MRFFCSLLTLAFAACLLVSAQQEPPSLADVARKSHDSGPKAKRVITDDNLNKSASPFPPMTTDGVYNSDDIVKAMCDFRHQHSPEDTEQAIHDWYDRYDMMFQQAFDENTAIKNRAQDRASHPLQLFYGDDDWKQMQQIRQEQVLSELQDQRITQKNGLLMARIQQTLQAVRTGISRSGMTYAWMKIRFGNGNGSY